MIKNLDEIGLTHAPAICYSGYREGQSPAERIYPSSEEVLEDLRILHERWKFLRMYDCGPHVETVLDVIEREGFDFRLMLGLDMGAEVNNPDCPWGAHYEPAVLEANRKRNKEEQLRAIELANRYPDIIFSLSIGNEASVDWTDHMVPVEHLTAYARFLHEHVRQPLTFSENYVPWLEKLGPLAEELDFLSVHTYPVWEYCSIDDALAVTQDNYYSVAKRHPDKLVVITEAGWCTATNGRGIEGHNANEELQATYFAQLEEWTEKEGILCFVFEAFDEPWKGSADPLEPEKHWGLFRVDRTPKLVMQQQFEGLVQSV